MTHKIYIMFVFTMVFLTNLTAQRAVKICGEYTYYAPENVSLEQAKKIALERAKLTALADEFGMTIIGVSVTDLKNYNEKSEIWFRRLSFSEVKGEWLSDTKAPKYKTSYAQDMLIVEVTICGNAREIKGAGIDFQTKALRSGTTIKHESDDFISGNDFYLWFRTPAQGYLAVYLIGDNETAYCMLPYEKNQTGNMFVKANRDYVFFSNEHAESDEKVTRYTLDCEHKSLEHNFLYIIFSPNAFTKANDTQTNPTRPPELSLENFQKWLAKNRQFDKDMKVDIKALTIKK